MSVRRLEVFRVDSQGLEQRVGVLAQDREVYFQYDADYLSHGHSLSPFRLPFTGELHRCTDRAQRLHGVFADSLPDGWGQLLIDRWLRSQGRLPQTLTLMDRLALVGERGMGALRYRPVENMPEAEALHELAELGKQAQATFDGSLDEILPQLLQAGSSGGARPKALIYLSADRQQVSTVPHAGCEPWLIKFTSASLALGHDEGRCEAAYLTLAQRAGIDVPEWCLYQTGDQAWLMTRRFDAPSAFGRVHMHSAAGLLDASFREPSLDYEGLIKATTVLCKSMEAGRQQLLRALFNLYACNMDDHSKNWAFLQADDGNWQPSPMFDVTFSPNPQGEHMTAYAGFGKAPPKKALERLARQAGVGQWAEVVRMIEQVRDVLVGWRD
jgi:serine/threonine-protein kinase HipA